MSMCVESKELIKLNYDNTRAHTIDFEAGEILHTFTSTVEFEWLGL